MIDSFRALRYHRFGIPAEVLQLDELPLPDRLEGSVLVKTDAAPINPADINVLEGTYPHRAEPPAIPGIEGCGTVIASDSPLYGTGQRVIAPRCGGNWCSHQVLPESELIALPPTIPVEQAAMLTVNPATAWRMLTDFIPLQPGDWVIQNAANSGVGRAVIQIARARGLNTINLVRREETVQELQDLGGTVTVVANDDAPKAIRAATGGAPVTLGLNATGGPILRLMNKCLTQSACLVTYGAMSREPVSLGNGQLIFKDLTARGFWITRWYQDATMHAIRGMMTDLIPLAAAGKLTVPVETTYPLAAYADAIAHATQDSRSGKILFQMND